MSIHPLDAASAVPDAAVLIERYTRESAATRTELPHRRDLRYGPSADETLDVFSAGDHAPLAVFFHGGYWRRLHKDDFSFIARGLVPLGISFACVNYGLAPTVPLREIVAQARRAVRWLRDNSEQLRVDPERISVFGHSAGGHLAAMTAIDMPVHAVTTISGLHDLEPLRTSFANEWLHLDEHEAHDLSPCNHAPARPLSLFATAGENESDAFKDQGRSLVNAWTRHGCAATYADSPGDDHFSIVMRLMNPSDPLTKKIADLAR